MIDKAIPCRSRAGAPARPRPLERLLPAGGHRERDLALMAAMDEVHTELPFYGSEKDQERAQRSRLHGRTRARDHPDAPMGITAIAPKRRLSKPAPGHKIYPYLLRGLEITEAGHVWSADITYLPLARASAT